MPIGVSSQDNRLTGTAAEDHGCQRQHVFFFEQVFLSRRFLASACSSQSFLRLEQPDHLLQHRIKASYCFVATAYLCDVFPFSMLLWENGTTKRTSLFVQWPATLSCFTYHHATLVEIFTLDTLVIVQHSITHMATLIMLWCEEDQDACD